MRWWPKAGSDGFTMVELITVAAVLGTLVRMAVPGLHDVLVRAQAAEVIANFRVVQTAVITYQADHLQWPADAATGQIPEGLLPYLPDGFDFDGPGYRLDWENWMVPDGLPDSPDVGLLLGISVVTPDRGLGRAVGDLLGGTTSGYELGDRYTFVIDRI